MSGARLTTGPVTFNASPKHKGEGSTPRNNHAEFHLVLIGDFSGRGSRQDSNRTALATRNILAVDRDNIDEVFQELNVRLRLPINDADIHFRALDDLHPDFLLSQAALFEQFTVLKNRLKKPEHFAAAVKEIQAINPQKIPTSLNDILSPASAPENFSGSSLDALLSEAQHRQTSTSVGDINQFIKQIVAPYAQAKVDPRVGEMLDAVDDAMAQTLRAVMHNTAFQQLEANWRGLEFLIRRLNTNQQLKIFVLDASREELIEDALIHDDISRSSLYQRLVTQYQVPGKIPFSCLQLNLTLSDNTDDLHLAVNLAEIAAETGAIALAGGSEKIAGCASLYEQPDSRDWDYVPNEEFATAWQAFRATALSRFIALAAPRFLLRLPYGKKTSPIESFDFTELPACQDHQYYCWGNSAYLVSLILAQHHQQFGPGFNTNIASEIDKLPIHAYQQGLENYIKPCAEILITDPVVARLNDAGLLVVRSIHGRPAVLIPALRTTADNGQRIFGSDAG